MSLATLYDTICALSTPPGKSAIAVMRITGSDAIRLAAKIITNPEKLFSLRGGDSFYTNIIDAENNHIDDVIVGVFRAPHSYTGEDLVEIHTHGSVLIIDILQNRLQSAGARLAEPGEFSRRAFMHGKISVEELELLSYRIDANSEQSLSKAEFFTKKKFERLRKIYDDLISLLSQINAEIDFGESDLVHIDGFSQKMESIRKGLQELLDQASNRIANKGYYSIALTGPPNVGKSSLFNALLKYERSIVSDIPGTTRDYLEAFMILDGYRIKLLDTAGLHDAPEEIESKGISLGKTAATEADLSLRITDPQTRNSTPENHEIIVHNKCDIDQYNKNISVSAKTGEGIDTLINFFKNKLKEFDSQYSSYSISESERSVIGTVLQTFDKIQADNEISLLAEDLRRAADSIASLLGYNISADSLEYIFGKMCIGK